MIPCPHCGSEASRVEATVNTSDGCVERKRQCYDCHRHFQTAEVLCVKAGRTRGLLIDEQAIPFAA